MGGRGGGSSGSSVSLPWPWLRFARSAGEERSTLVRANLDTEATKLTKVRSNFQEFRKIFDASQVVF
jgi:hypothetical protein